MQFITILIENHPKAFFNFLIQTVYFIMYSYNNDPQY